MKKPLLTLLTCIVFSCLCISCEKEENFGFPSKIEISDKGGTIELESSNDLTPTIKQIELLDYNGEGNSSPLYIENPECIEVTTEWLNVKYYSIANKLVLTAEPNLTDQKRILYLYLYSGNAEQEIRVTQFTQ
ncbi:MAG: hypothetical protein K2I69_02750 [Muribaculaceae bacterium]|nr:hypothetical protein [Muribaculaceae bacterium]